MNERNGWLTILFPFPKAKNKPSEKQVFPYALRDDFLSAAELSFYKTLVQALESVHVTICPKPGLQDVFHTSTSDKKSFYHFNNKIARKHVDFLVCDPRKMKPLLGIELDDASHNRQRRVERDMFVDQVFKNAGIPLVRFQAKKAYTIEEIQEKIKTTLSQRLRAEHQNESCGPPVCPKCKLPMVMRRAARGEKKGKSILGLQQLSSLQGNRSGYIDLML